jgi:hypothetical protein
MKSIIEPHVRSPEMQTLDALLRIEELLERLLATKANPAPPDKKVSRTR